MFEKIKSRYEKGYVRLEQLRRYAELGVITAEQYEEICGKGYKQGSIEDEVIEDD